MPLNRAPATGLAAAPARWRRSSLVLMLATALFAVVAAFTTYRVYGAEAEVERAGVREMLLANAQSKAAAIDGWRRQRAAEAWFLAHELNEAWAAAPQGPPAPATPRDFHAWLASVSRLPGQQGVALYSARRTQLCATAGFPATLGPIAQAALDEAARLGRVVFSAPFRDAPRAPPQVSVVAPLPDEPQLPSRGFLVFRIDLATTIDPILSTTFRTSPQSRYLLMVRNPGGFVVADRTGINRPALLLAPALAAAGPPAPFEATTERGDPIVAAAAAVPDSPWFVAGTATRADVEAPIRERGWLLALALAGLTAAGAMVAVVFVSRAQTAAYRRQYEQEAARARAEEAQRHAEGTLHALLEFAPMPIYVVSSPGRFVLVNAAWEAATGVDRATALAHPSIGLFPSDVAREFQRSTQQVFETREMVRYDQEFDVGGSRRRFDTIKFPIFDDAGAVIAVGGILLDVTERKRFENDLRKESAQTKALLRVAERVASTLDRDSVLDTLCREVAQALNADAVNIKLFQDDGYLLHAASFGLPAEWVDGDKAITLEQYLSIVGPTGEAIWPDVQAPGSVVRLDQYTRFDIRSVMGVLITVNRVPLGTLAVYSRGRIRQFEEHDLELLRGVANLAATALANAQLFDESHRQAARLRTLAARLSEIEDHERARLSRELHDQVGQNLTALGVSLNLAALDARQGSMSALHQRLAAAQDSVAETARSIRNVLLDLRPPALDDHGLVAALRSSGSRLAANTGLRVFIEGTEPSPPMGPRVAGVLYRIAQEALTNAVKHARATTLRVTVSEAGTKIRMTVTDDGCGFDVRHRAAGGRPSWGLLNMEERARGIGAQVRIDSAPGNGTTVIVEADR